MEKFYIIKIWERRFSKLINGLKSDNANAVYNLAENDMDFKGEIKIDDKILFISFRVENSEISYLDAIACRIVDINGSNLTCKTEAFTDKKLIIENLCNMLLIVMMNILELVNCNLMMVDRPIHVIEIELYIPKLLDEW